MTEFERKRLEYFIRTAKEHGYVQLGPVDIKLFQLYIDLGKIDEDHQKHIDAHKQLEAELASEQIPIDKPVKI